MREHLRSEKRVDVVAGPDAPASFRGSEYTATAERSIVCLLIYAQSAGQASELGIPSVGRLGSGRIIGVA